MRALRNLPIKRKLTAITMLTSGVALLLACIAFVAYGSLTVYSDGAGRGAIFTLELPLQPLKSMHEK
jgi:hypothetical protein